eukprot:12091-Heterococcus_DN1.PRE.7
MARALCKHPLRSSLLQRKPLRCMRPAAENCSRLYKRLLALSTSCCWGSTQSTNETTPPVNNTARVSPAAYIMCTMHAARCIAVQTRIVVVSCEEHSCAMSVHRLSAALYLYEHGGASQQALSYEE